MAKSTAREKLITIDRAKELTNRYLLDKYYDFEKILFSGYEVITLEDTTLYRLYGSIRVKSRSLVDQIGFLRKADTYKFMADINAVSGKIFNYAFH